MAVYYYSALLDREGMAACTVLGSLLLLVCLCSLKATGLVVGSLSVLLEHFSELFVKNQSPQ